MGIPQISGDLIKEPQIACYPLSSFQGLCEIGVVISIFKDEKQRLGEVN